MCLVLNCLIAQKKKIQANSLLAYKVNKQELLYSYSIQLS